MRALKRWPWITLAAGTAVALSPPGRDFIYSAFFSGEALSRNIARPILFAALLVLAVLILLEWFVRWRFARRRDKASATKDTPHSGSAHEGTGRG